MTPEEMQEKIVELTDENTQLKADKETLSKDNETLKADLENSRTLCQKYFNKIVAGEKDEPNEEDDENETTCEEFAKTLTDKF